MFIVSCLIKSYHQTEGVFSWNNCVYTPFLLYCFSMKKENKQETIYTIKPWLDKVTCINHSIILINKKFISRESTCHQSKIVNLGQQYLSTQNE